MTVDGPLKAKREREIKGVRSVEGPKRRWRDGVVWQQGGTWTRTAKGQRKLEDWWRATSYSGKTQPSIA